MHQINLNKRTITYQCLMLVSAPLTSLQHLRLRFAAQSWLPLAFLLEGISAFWSVDPGLWRSIASEGCSFLDEFWDHLWKRFWISQRKADRLRKQLVHEKGGRMLAEPQNMRGNALRQVVRQRRITAVVVKFSVTIFTNDYLISFKLKLSVHNCFAHFLRLHCLTKTNNIYHKSKTAV